MNDNESRHLSLLYDISELSSIVSETKGIDTFLQQVVQSVASHLNADVGSIYLLDDESGELVLKATKGLNPDSVDHVRMKIGEGLVGTTLARMAPLCDGIACQNPHFKHFAEADEDPYQSFLSVPINRGIEKIGVLVVQHTQPDYFDAADIMALRAIASQLAGTVAHVRLMSGLQKPKKEKDALSRIEGLSFIKGDTASSGFALAQACPLTSESPLLVDVPDAAFRTTARDYRRALQDTLAQLGQLQERLVRRLPEGAALIFEAHHMILKEPRFDRQILDLIQQDISAPEAVRQVAKQFISLFESSPSPYIREKSHDIEDLATRILFNLRKDKGEGSSPIDGRIVIASQLYPSDLLKLASEKVAGIILVSGGATSHVAIIARSLQIPLIIAHNSRLLDIPAGTSILMDAEVGNIYVAPSAQIRRNFEERERVLRATQTQAAMMTPQTHTADGVRIHLLANINLLSELALARELNAEGVGLYRSEFPFIVRSVFPSEEEQRLVYARLFQGMPGLPIHVRTLDIGGDKVLPYLNLPMEANPELGLRSIRFLLKHRDVFDQQLRAILRAAAGAAHVGILFPMISSLDEFLAARQAAMEAMESLAGDHLAYHPAPSFGAMIEMPSVLTIIDELAEAVDFFSIGTNDFIQYMLAVDRTNENVAEFFEPFQPAILRALATMVQRAGDHGKPVSVCGETAHDTEFVAFLIGIGVRRLSLDPQFLPVVQQAIAAIPIVEAQAFAEALVKASSMKAVREARAQWRARGGA